MLCRGIRGAITVDSNTSQDILAASRELLKEMIAANDVHPEDVAAALFSTTTDLDADFPARAAREMGWNDAPLMCGNEMAVPGSLDRCLRILLLINTEKRSDEIVHIYLKGAGVLRPDREYHPQG
ncbi:MAG TPA: chorismate mutase [Dehalococcoidia bacterium]|nr:chorismate mutase [Dehalococcoidia bacterium]